MQGNVKWLGKYDECVDLPLIDGHMNLSIFTFHVKNDGQYCQLLLKLPGLHAF